MHNRSSFFRNLAKIDLLVIDDFGIAPIVDQTQRDLLEILDDRYDKKSTILTSQLPVEQWHACLGDPTLADAGRRHPRSPRPQQLSPQTRRRFDEKT